MLYNRFSDTELERAVYIDPANTVARDEMIARVPALLDNRSDQMQDLEMQLEAAEQEHKSTVVNFQGDLAAAESHADELQRDLDQARNRIARIARLATDECPV